ncbi:dihydrofolate synthase / folylpolyglutamate synthase [Eubacterium ruminantium]|uniref:tetrahydrofolate synthase n=2 Tax=Eubacteriaceae TaxID=186806 RepID=A0A1T4K7Q9_9FIRM|nr:dihydrofolate synthase / folylpolyglutamate synthase [Eubacterium ruminantium]SDM18822.1 dihydrofolate synthase / folylpolyglutamate synthase [Eubacterium ruminantium]SJZ38449.1 dihydrofolate synthase / folylpolyglutamate synthase [Eubacterium ruminantium]
MLTVEDIVNDEKKLSIQDVTEYILAIPKFAEKIGTENLRKVMDKLGNPQNKVKAVHIAGTNGKGSTTEMIRLMLSEAGYKTGAFTSPHLVKINERIKIDGVDISDEDFIASFRDVMKVVDKYSLMHPSFFEYIFAMAAVYYERQNVDYVVYETGMGGRLDATNIIDPVVTVITSIGMDHMQYLGDTVEKIAYEKAGIIKPGVPVIHNCIDHGDIDKDLKIKASKVIEDTAKANDSKCIFISEVDERLNEWLGLKNSENTVKAVNNPAFYVQYQKENASAAIKAFESIMSLTRDKALESYDVILRALNNFKMPARMEKIKNNVIIDGAHNTDAIPQFLSAVRDMVDREKPANVKFIFAVSNDKDYPAMVRMICESKLFDEIYLTTFNSYRTTDADSICKLFREMIDNNAEYGKKIKTVRSIPILSECLDTVLSGLLDNEMLFTAGSLYLAGEIEAYKEIHNA